MQAVRHGRNELIGVLMQNQADPTLTDSEGHTAADVARASGNGEALSTLVPQ